MSARGTMRHRATIQRDANADETDPDGNALAPDWQDHLTSHPCRVRFDAGRELVGEVNAVVEDRKMIVPKGTDVTEADRVAGPVTDRLGNALAGFEGDMRIESVGGRADHLVLMLEAV